MNVLAKSKSLYFRRVILIAIIFIATAFILKGQGGIDANMAPTTEIAVVADSGKHRFDVEVADTPEEMQQGLMNRPALADDAGMIFLFDSPRVVSFWMKDTLIPLDMIFIDAAGTIAHLHPRAVPNDTTSVSSQEEVVAVLEIAGGRAEALGIEIGDRVEGLPKPGEIPNAAPVPANENIEENSEIEVTPATTGTDAP